MNTIVLTGMGHWFPQTILDNQFFEELDIGSSAPWINERVGIAERRSVLRREDILRLRREQVTREELMAQGLIMPMAKMAPFPWQMALDRSQAAGHEAHPDLMISGTSVPDWDIPANACAMAHELGLECAGFDVNSACSSFVVNLHVARGLMSTGMARTVGILNVERYTTRVDYRDRSSCVLFGDGAAAAILTTQEGVRGLQLVDTVVHSSPAGAPHVKLPEGGTFSQNGAAVQKFAVTKTVAVAQEILQRQGLTAADVRFFIGHQANARMLSSAADKLGFGPEQHLSNVHLYGNQGGAGAPSVLSMHWATYQPGDFILVAVVGSGLTWGAALFKTC